MLTKIEKIIITSLLIIGLANLFIFEVYGSTWVQTTEAEFNAGVLSQVDTSTSSGDVILAQRNCWGIGGSCNGNCLYTTRTGPFTRYTGNGPCSATKSCTTRSDCYNFGEAGCSGSGAGTCYKQNNIISATTGCYEGNGCNSGNCSGSCTCTGKSQIICIVCQLAGGGCSWSGSACVGTCNCAAADDGLESGCESCGCSWEWTEWYWLATEMLTYWDSGSVCSWYKYYASGTLASQVNDTGSADTSWHQLSWSETLLAGTDITFEVRASDTSFLKTDASPSWTAVGGTSPVTSGLPGGRYQQWRATLTTSVSGNTPTLHDVTVTYELQAAPTITDVTDAPDPVTVGSDITFTVDWNDVNEEGVKMFICKTDAIETATPGCDDGTWCSDSDDWDETDPIDCDYTTQDGEINGVQDYYAFVCDNSISCSSSTSGTFTVENAAPTITSVTDTPDPVIVGNDITFSVDWNDINDAGIKMLICKTDAITAATPACDGGEWCSNKDDYDATDPITCLYTSQAGDIDEALSYYAFVCDDHPECSTSESGSFSVEAGTIIRIKGGGKIEIEGGGTIKIQ